MKIQESTKETHVKTWKSKKKQIKNVKNGNMKTKWRRTLALFVTQTSRQRSLLQWGAAAPHSVGQCNRRELFSIILRPRVQIVERNDDENLVGTCRLSNETLHLKKIFHGNLQNGRFAFDTTCHGVLSTLPRRDKWKNRPLVHTSFP